MGLEALLFFLFVDVLVNLIIHVYVNLLQK